MQDLSPILLSLLAIFGLVFANGFFVAAEFALVTVRKTRIDQLIAEGNRTARAVRRALVDPDRFIAATQLGITMASLGLGWIGEPAVAALIEPALRVFGENVAWFSAHSIAVAFGFAVITALHIVLGELAPKTVALQYPERTSLFVVPPTHLFMRIFGPFITLLNGTGRAVVRGLGLRAPSGHSLVHSEEELKMLVTASQEAGVIEEEEEQMLHRVFGFADLTAGQVMVPRTEMVAIPATASLETLVDLIVSSGHDRLPVYGNDLDDVVGVLQLSDVLPAVARGAELDIVKLAREAWTVPETVTADTLLSEMRKRRTPLAIVIDEYGGTAGLVTFAGLMEHIVGEIGDGEGTRIRTLADGSALVDGLALVTDVNAQFGLHISEGAYNTLGGYVLGRLGRRPRVGDRIEVERRWMRVDALDGLRVARVFISREKPRPADEQSSVHDEHEH
jgi:CBS domain containing-hemolysin-like protein